MLRLLGYVLAVFALIFVLRHVPGLGWLFGIPFLNFLLAAAILSAVVGWWTSRAVETRRLRRLEREFGAVDTPHNQGKLGALLLASGRARRAIPHLERAAQGEPERAEWHHRLGAARLAVGDPRAATLALERALAADPDHAFGVPRLRLAEARLAAGEAAGSLAAAEAFETRHGPSAESAYRRGLALRALGRQTEARAAFAAVPGLARTLGRAGRRAGAWWGLKAWFRARL
ncbi:MAG: tetratricopeptide repeat protein [Planctomycetes bacterium]|nr:tetratricopeptide repeat protein [Planctomycetota bacterium]